MLASYQTALFEPWMTRSAGCSELAPTDPTLILPQMISMVGQSDADPYAVLGVLIEGAASTLTQHVPAERRADTAATLAQLLEERLKAHGLTGDDQ
jgi:hypothetical protein